MKFRGTLLLLLLFQVVHLKCFKIPPVRSMGIYLLTKDDCPFIGNILRDPFQPRNIFEDIVMVNFVGIYDILFIVGRDPQNFNPINIAQKLKDSKNWRYETKVVLTFTETAVEFSSDERRILEGFSKETIYNVAIVKTNKIGDPLVGYTHFPHEPSRNALRTINQLKELGELFPNKVKNLNGFQLQAHALSKVITMENGKEIINNDWDAPIFSIFINRTNATFQFITYEFCEVSSSFKEKLSPGTDILAHESLGHVSNNIFHEYAVIWINQPDEIGVMVTSLPVNNSDWFREIFTRWIPYHILAVLAVVLYNGVYLNKRGFALFNFNMIVPIALFQSVAEVHRPHKRRGSKVFLGALVMLMYILSLFILVTITTKYIVYTPDRSLQTVEDVIKSGIPMKHRLFCSEYLTDIPNIPFSKLPVWDMPRSNKKEAFFVFKSAYIMNIASGPNLDANEREKYYFIKKDFQKMTRTHRMPLNSPFTSVLRDIYYRSFEAGFYKWWKIYYGYVQKYNGFKIFPNITHGKSEPRPLQVENLHFAFLILVIGLGISLVVFLIEMIIKVKQQRRPWVVRQRKFLI